MQKVDEVTISLGANESYSGTLTWSQTDAGEWSLVTESDNSGDVYEDATVESYTTIDASGDATASGLTWTDSRRRRWLYGQGSSTVSTYAASERIAGIGGNGVASATSLIDIVRSRHTDGDAVSTGILAVDPLRIAGLTTDSAGVGDGTGWVDVTQVGLENAYGHGQAKSSTVAEPQFIGRAGAVATATGTADGSKQRSRTLSGDGQGTFTVDDLEIDWIAGLSTNSSGIASTTGYPVRSTPSEGGEALAEATSDALAVEVLYTDALGSAIASSDADAESFYVDPKLTAIVQSNEVRTKYSRHALGRRTQHPYEAAAVLVQVPRGGVPERDWSND